MVVGRKPLKNILTEWQGFALDLRPQSRLESFYAIFDEILDASVRYTNIAGSRLGHEKNFIWKKTNREEIEAFIGLHILDGKCSYHLPT